MKQTIIKKTASGVKVTFYVNDESYQIPLELTAPDGEEIKGSIDTTTEIKYLKKEKIHVVPYVHEQGTRKSMKYLTISEKDLKEIQAPWLAKEKEKEKEAPEKAESKKQEAFLKSKGYIRQLVDDYDYDYDEDYGKDEVELLRGNLSREEMQSYRYFKNGEMVKEYKKELLIKEGYFGEQVKAEKAQAKEEAKKITAEKESLKKEIETSFKKAEKPEKKGENFIKLETGKKYCDNIDIYGGGGYYFIDEKQEFIWKIINNGSDGDDWSHNNISNFGAGAIGVRLSYSETLATKIIKLNKLTVKA